MATSAAREKIAARARMFCAAPMMRYSHAAARRLWRFLCPPALLYTEMLNCNAIIRGRRELRGRILDFAGPSPVALQLGGGEAAALAAAAQIGEECGAAEININCGCPSPRVLHGNFGACLMKTPQTAGAMVAAVKKAVSIPVTVKCRIAVDDMDAESGLDIFARAVLENGGAALILHARRALLKGLNPAQNRAAPPLDYARARRLKQSMGAFPVVINGGIGGVESAQTHLQYFDGAMLGRAIVRRPYLLAEAARTVYGIAAPSRAEALRFMLEDAARRPPKEWPRAVSALAGLFHG
ncbi:MAG: tRNA dihydrouridine(20/20a) synthase DusA, partial [Betaproteobacteria bacterium]|nr:tRNA dihydrouridine(20/20a) synthase DusA [Betaproteobacteria bacterium]